MVDQIGVLLHFNLLSTRIWYQKRNMSLYNLHISMYSCEFMSDAILAPSNAWCTSKFHFVDVTFPLKFQLVGTHSHWVQCQILINLIIDYTRNVYILVNDGRF
jgi:hypothetical protein